MLFNSIDFAIFIPVVFVLYWFVVNKHLKLQNALVVGASYVFYGWWDWRFLSLIIFSTLVDYSVGLLLQKEKSKLKRKAFLWLSILVNLGFLGFFKYYNFFLENFVSAFSFFGNEINANSLNIILPVGISFYTFQTLSYTIDVYRKKLKPSNDFIAFSAFVSFFPQLVAGPIERATNLLPQFYKHRKFDYNLATNGMRQILWGLVKKIVIADNCAAFANDIFNHTEAYSGSTLLLGAVFFSFQIYGDFSGYSDIAIGTSKLFGFNLKQNFAFPYFSRDIAEFWRRWHISLSTWFRDYVYIPLGGSRGGTLMKIRNTFIIFIVSGFWHGAKWTFVIWGLLNALYFLPLLLSNKNRNNLGLVSEDSFLPSIKEFCQMTLTFGLTVFAWIFFRADSLSHAFLYIKKLCSGLTDSFFYYQAYRYLTRIDIGLIVIIFLFFVLEWIGKKDQFAIENFTGKWPKPVRYIFYYILILCLFIYGGEEQQFIYFQF